MSYVRRSGLTKIYMVGYINDPFDAWNSLTTCSSCNLLQDLCDISEENNNQVNNLPSREGTVIFLMLSCVHIPTTLKILNWLLV